VSDAGVERWSADRVGDLAELWRVSAPHEPLTADELAGVCFDDGGVVLAAPGGTGAVAAVVRPAETGPVGHIRLVVVHPDARRRGVGSALVAAAEQWLAGHGAVQACWAGEAPVYLWPGVDATDVATQCLAEACGYRPTTSAINMGLPSDFRAPAPASVVVRRVVGDAEVAAVRAMVATHWPQWLVEFDLGIEVAGIHAAFGSDDDQPVGFGALSVLRTGWFGPIGVVPQARLGGVGASLVSAACTDAMVAGLAGIEVSWVGPMRFYASLGARVSRSFRRWERPLG